MARGATVRARRTAAAASVMPLRFAGAESAPATSQTAGQRFALCALSSQLSIASAVELTRSFAGRCLLLAVGAQVAECCSIGSVWVDRRQSIALA